MAQPQAAHCMPRPLCWHPAPLGHMQMLPAVYRVIAASWGATPTQLGYITLARALVQALSAPIGGIAGAGHPAVGHYRCKPARNGCWRCRCAPLACCSFHFLPEISSHCCACGHRLAGRLLTGGRLQALCGGRVRAALLAPSAPVMQATACTVARWWAAAACCGHPRPQPLPPATLCARAWPYGL